MKFWIARDKEGGLYLIITSHVRMKFWKDLLVALNRTVSGKKSMN